MDRMDHIKDICLRMEDLCADAGIPPFDRVKYASAPEELWFLWGEPKRCVIVELDAGPDALTAALAGATGGDAVLN
ncbi:MAG: hypothetical protein Q7T55_19265 [Solirubrobacteraceae bacterium]|nr:hypothetical protein [Solirubrobacteraceae bacterium]